MVFTKKEEVAIMKALHSIMNKLEVRDINTYWDLVDGVKKRGGEMSKVIRR